MSLMTGRVYPPPPPVPCAVAWEVYPPGRGHRAIYQKTGTGVVFQKTALARRKRGLKGNDSRPRFLSGGEDALADEADDDG